MASINANHPDVEPVRIVNPNLINACLNLASPGIDAIAGERARYGALERQLKELEKFVYRHKSIWGALISFVKDNVILQEEEWYGIVSKKNELKAEMEDIQAVLRKYQQRMDSLLVNLPAE